MVGMLDQCGMGITNRKLCESCSAEDCSYIGEDNMESKQPTPAEVEEFWERCDLYAEERGAWSGKKFYSWFAPNKLFICDDAPPIDLNNLFRYAVPKLNKPCYLQYDPDFLEFDACVHEHHDSISNSTNSDPALALFWAIWSVFHAN
jgi:hypothetical protein